MGILTKTRKIICENSYGYKLEFGYSFPYFLSKYSGVHEYSGNVATVKSAFGVGVSYIGTSVNQRDINLVISFKDDELLRDRKNQIYNIFPQKDKGTLFFYEGDIVRKINYYVEKVNLVRQAGGIYNASIDLICPSPYFMDSEETIVELNNWDKLFKFPFEIPDGTGFEFGSKNESTMMEIINDSHIPYGLTITYNANGNVSNPKLTNTSNGEIMEIKINLTAGESIVITTYNNEKEIVHIDANGNETSINNTLVFGTKFLQAKNGVNKFVPSAETGGENLDCSISYYNYYEAV